MNKRSNNDNSITVITGDDAKSFFEHFSTCFIAVSKHETIYSEKRVLEVRESYELIQSLVKEG